MATTPLLPHTVLNTLIRVPPSCFSDVTSSLSRCCSWRMDLDFIVPHGEIPFHSPPPTDNFHPKTAHTQKHIAKKTVLTYGNHPQENTHANILVLLPAVLPQFGETVCSGTIHLLNGLLSPSLHICSSSHMSHMSHMSGETVLWIKWW